jgi:hypothetical protein
MKLCVASAPRHRKSSRHGSSPPPLGPPVRRPRILGYVAKYVKFNRVRLGLRRPTVVVSALVGYVNFRLSAPDRRPARSAPITALTAGAAAAHGATGTADSDSGIGASIGIRPLLLHSAAAAGAHTPAELPRRGSRRGDRDTRQGQRGSAIGEGRKRQRPGAA